MAWIPSYDGMTTSRKSGFTLIELSIVLVIIGLLVGGVMVGRDLIASAEIRSQVSQIEQYNTAVHTFKIKYNALPGDMKASEVDAAGFTNVVPRLGTRAEGDGNGILEGIWSGGTSNLLQHGETVWFWVDLTVNSGLINGNFNSATATPTIADVLRYSNSSPYISKILPVAKLGDINFITVFSQGIDNNYYIISKLTRLDGNGASYNQSTSLALSINQANYIDSKMDDGLPQSGIITARYTNWSLNTTRLTWASGGGVEGEQEQQLHQLLQPLAMTMAM